MAVPSETIDVDSGAVGQADAASGVCGGREPAEIHGEGLIDWNIEWAEVAFDGEFSIVQLLRRAGCDVAVGESQRRASDACGLGDIATPGADPQIGKEDGAAAAVVGLNADDVLALGEALFRVLPEASDRHAVEEEVGGAGLGIDKEAHGEARGRLRQLVLKGNVAPEGLLVLIARIVDDEVKIAVGDRCLEARVSLPGGNG